MVGHRAEKALADCLARNCPPAQEVEASLQASVELFADGRYTDAQRTLQKAIRRNRDKAAQMPGPVSSLYATLATVAEHQGDRDLWLSSARNNMLVLQRHLGETHKATLVQELAFADNMVGLGKSDAAADIYHRVQRKAAADGQTDLAAGAAFRRAWLASLLERDGEAERIAGEAVALAGGSNTIMLELRDILRARVAIRRGDDGAVDALADRIRQSPTKAPKLLYARPVDDLNSKLVSLDPRNQGGVRFADVGYWIRPDGRTRGVEVLRTSGLGQWGPAILRQVSGRRYAPLDAQPDWPGMYRIDRFTVRQAIGKPVGSFIRRRAGNYSVHIIDLTETDAMTVANRERTQQDMPALTDENPS
ncbi:hypothetical protein U5A82_16345 [Sphingobium sp. CR2-8]|uniref:hypothetical protein n=1 Tax=Sphingobium sp. CR2-8 TaxID=1306534 RepID=UPI002DBAA962|nr:hypothetical protein [Sphingobium sp. CR2-8]MEC3911985.1 hypothetical protein [Sphingobium sp. CR2-8]